jgi:type I restriction enzyme M protein
LAKRKNNAQATETTGATVGYEAQLWRMADALRGSMDAAEYKHVVLGLIFLKYISDAFEEQHAKLVAEQAQGADPEDPDEYRAENIFWVPPEARWAHLKAQAKQPTIGQLVDDAMAAIERDNPALQGVLPKDYARPALDKSRLGQLIDLISNIRVGDEASRAKDVLGRVYEYFLSQFASAEGKKGGEFYTPRCVVKLLVEMLRPYRGRVYDPCCGSAGTFVQSVEFIRAHASGNGNLPAGRQAAGKARADISIYGQESNYTTWRLAKMNLAIRGIDGQIAHGDTFHNDRFPDLKADFILANPPFNVSDWGGERPRRQALEVRRAARRQRQLRLGAAHRPPPGARWRSRLRAPQRLGVLQPVGRGRDPQEPDRGRPRGLHGRPARPALLLDANSRLSLVPGARPQERQVPRPARGSAFY